MLKQYYIAELDGLRSIAIIFVLLGHFGIFDFGWVGVQLFFVLSGYLITKNLFFEKDKLNKKSNLLFNFYVKRTLRLFPTYYLYIIFFIFFAICTQQFNSIKVLLLPLFTYTLNIFAIFNNSNNFTGVGHFWSLAVEEQFYLLWPFLIYFLSKKNFSIFLKVLILFIPFLRLFLFQIIKLRSNSINLAGEVVNLTTISHFDAFASGAFVIFLLEKYRNLNIKKIKIIIFISTLCFILIGFVNILSNSKNNVPGLHEILTFGFPHLMIKNFGYFWGYSLINTYCAIILFSVLKFPDLFYILKNKFLVFTGKISYGLYLFHIPVLLLTQWLNSDKIYNNVISLIIYISLTYLISFLSYEYIERFFLKLKNKII